MSKLKQKDLRAYRAAMVIQQGNSCPLCHTHLEPADAVLDHCHDTGHIRFALHRSCNHAEGNVRGWAKRTRAKSKKEFVQNVVLHWDKDYSHNPLHPSFKTVEDKRAKVLKKRLKTVKAPHARKKIQAELALLKAKKD